MANCAQISAFLLIFGPLLLLPHMGLAKESDSLRVCPDCAIRTIHEAISRAQPGNLILVGKGHYQESEIVIDKPLRLHGMNLPVVDANGKGNVFSIHAPDVEISGFKIENSGFSYVQDFAGIKIENSDRCVLRDDLISNCFFAIHIANSAECKIDGNTIQGNPSHGESAAGNGIHLWHARDMLIRNNQVSGQRDGIYFEFVTNSQIIGNLSEHNLRYGLHFMYSSGNTYKDNTFKQNSSGVAVMYSKGIRMEHNRFEDSWGGAAYGILMKEISQSEIRNNTFKSNTVGAYLDGTTRSVLEYNDFLGNGWALRILGDSEENRVTHNNFVDNTFDLSTNSSTSQNHYVENYWSDYTGVDLDRDGIGDTVFHPARLSSMLMEKRGVSVLLLKSLFFSIADEAESALPILTPDALKDERPLMRKAVSP